MDQDAEILEDKLEQSLNNLISDYTETESEQVYNNRGKYPRGQTITPMHQPSQRSTSEQ